jgi:tetratricopeptide (TPR) repeat protein
MDASQGTFHEALSALNNRDLAAAERLFRTVLAARPDHVAALNLLTTVLMATERFEQAEGFIARAVTLEQNSDVSFYNYGLILKHLKKPEQALEQFTKALRLNAKVADTWNNRGTVFNDLKRYDEAISDFDHALSLNPAYVDSLNNKAKSLIALGQLDDALAQYDKALSLKPDLAEAWLGRGNVLYAMKRHENALLAYGKALAFKPGLADIWLVYGNICTDLARYDEALAAYERALALKPDLAEAWLGRGNVSYQARQYDKAALAYDRALAFKPDLAEAWLGRGNVACEAGQVDEALAAQDSALALKPDLAGAWLGRGNALAELDRVEEALGCFDKCIALDQNLADGYFNKSLQTLLIEHYAEGWKLYEWRWKTQAQQRFVRDFEQPLWLGDSELSGKTILVHAEQGFGDTIQFSRYLPLLKERGCDVIFEAQQPLVALLESQNFDIEILPEGSAVPHFDVHCPLLSLPLAFATDADTIPSTVYLRADPRKVSAWGDRLSGNTRRRIGLVWSGNPHFRKDIRRSMHLETILPIITDDHQWFSLQKEIREHDRGLLSGKTGLQDLSEWLVDFSDTAAAISQMDLVISTDTAVAHLAGALGKPVWVLLQFHPDFRWLRDGEDSPWYPTARLFRQTRLDRWDDVIARISAELND